MLVFHDKAVVIWILNTVIVSYITYTSAIMLAFSLENKIWILTTLCFFHSQNSNLKLLSSKSAANVSGRKAGG